MNEINLSNDFVFYLITVWQSNVIVSDRVNNQYSIRYNGETKKIG